MQTVEINPRELVEYDGNAKIHSRKQLNAIKTSIENFGFVNPVVAWHNGEGQAGRKARCVELEPKYCDVIIRRWEEETGETAVLLDA